MSKLRQFRRALRACVGKPVAYQIHDGHGAALAPVLERVIRGERIHDGDVLAAMLDEDMDLERLEALSEKLAGPMIIPGGKNGKATALVSVRGTALYDVEFQPMAFSTLLLSQTMTALANDPEIGTIVLDIDSPGGSVTGTQEAADAIFKARQTTNVVALVNPLAASAAYYLASQASEIVAVPSADVGSIGVFMMHANCAGMMEGMGVETTFIYAGKYKIEGNMFEALSEDAKAYLQGEVDTIYSDFIKAVARGRGVSAAKVERDFGQGRTLMAKQAKAAGMIDRIATINQALARWGVSGQMVKGRRRGEDVGTEPAALVGENGPEAEALDTGMTTISLTYPIGDVQEIDPADTSAEPGQLIAGELSSGGDPFANAETGDIVEGVNGKRYLATERNGWRAWQLIEQGDRITYCHVDKTPDFVMNVEVIDDESGAEVSHVIECNAEEGWLIRFAGDKPALCDRTPPCPQCDPHKDHVRVERVEGNFRIERKEAKDGTDEADASPVPTAAEARNRRLALLRQG